MKTPDEAHTASASIGQCQVVSIGAKPCVVESDKVTNIECLPDDLLLHIFRSLPVVERIVSVELVCKRWFDCCRRPQLWHTVEMGRDKRLRRKVDKPLLSNMVYFSTGARVLMGSATWPGACPIRHLSLFGCTTTLSCHELARLILNWCPNLHHLDLSGLTSRHNRQPAVFFVPDMVLLQEICRRRRTLRTVVVDAASPGLWHQPQQQLETIDSFLEAQLQRPLLRIRTFTLCQPFIPVLFEAHGGWGPRLMPPSVGQPPYSVWYLFEGLMRMIASCKHLQELHIRGGNGISNEGVEMLCNALKETKSVVKLSLPCNYIGNRGAAAIASACKAGVPLQLLELKGNDMDDAAADHLAQIVQGSKTLACLDLNSNMLTAKGAQQLMKAIQANSAFSQLVLSKNRVLEQQQTQLQDLAEEWGIHTKITLC